MIPLGDLRRDYVELAEELEEAALRVLRSGWYVLGAEVRAFEQELAAYCGSNHAVAVNSGTDALYLALCALGVGPDDEVVTVANASIYSTTAILQAGARPVYVDVEPVSHNMNPALIEAALSPRTKAILPVHLYGRACDLDAIGAIARDHGVALIEDCAQAHGTRYHDRHVGTFGTVGCFSFYPSKNLGALGDGGALICGDAALAERLRRLRQYGWERRYYSSEPGGINSRLDEIQAALLRVKLRHLDSAVARRRSLAALYHELLAGLSLTLPQANGLADHSYHLYVVSCSQRDALQTALRENGVACDVHYPLPAHLQPAYQSLGYRPASLPVTERLANEVLSLPLFATLSHDEARQVAQAVRKSLPI